MVRTKTKKKEFFHKNKNKKVILVFLGGKQLSHITE
jgi:hypothetical protein